MKKSLYPVLFLVMAFVVVLFADDTIFEGIFMTERLSMTNTSNKASAILQTGTILHPSEASLILRGTNNLGYLRWAAYAVGGLEEEGLFAGVSQSKVFSVNNQTVSVATDGSHNLVLGHVSAITTFPSLVSTIPGLSVWGGGDLVWSGNGGTLTNRGSFTSLNTITASNFVQSATSAGGFVGNGSGLTNLTGSGVGGFTSGSVIFAGATGALSQDNTNFFWDITNKSLGIGTNAIPATVKLEVNGPLQVEGPAIITSSGPITNIIGGVSGLIPSVYVTNVSADFPSTLTLAGADLNFSVPATILTNSVVMIGRPSTEVTGLVTIALMTNAGQVVIRARNVTAGTIDQAALPYRISIQVNPTQ